MRPEAQNLFKIGVAVNYLNRKVFAAYFRGLKRRILFLTFTETFHPNNNLSLAGLNTSVTSTRKIKQLLTYNSFSQKDLKRSQSIKNVKINRNSALNIIIKSL